MNLDDLLNELHRTLSKTQGKSNEYEVLMSLEMLDEIYWHLRQYREKYGNAGRPDPRAEQRRYEKADEFWRAQYEKERANEFWGDFNQKYRDYEEIFKQYSQKSSDEAWRNAFYGNAGKQQSNKQEGWYRAQGKTTPNKKSAWDILGLRPGATKQQIIKAYRSLAMKLHPDRPNGNTAAFQELKAAKEELVGK